MDQQPSHANDWKRHWEQSIAVRISGVVLWALVPLVLAVTFFLLFDLEDNIEKEFQDKADILIHRTIMAIVHSPDGTLESIRNVVESMREEMGFQAIVVTFKESELKLGDFKEGDPYVMRSSTIQSHTGHMHHDHTDSEMPEDLVEISAYHPSVSALAKRKQRNIVLPILAGLLIFGVFLVLAVRALVHKPLLVLVDATRAISAGDDKVRLNESRQDEFGYLAKFFNNMVDELTDKQHRLELALQEANRANQAKSIFLANTSHELRTPLNAIIGYSEMLAEEAGCCGDGRECLDDIYKIREAGKHLLGLINNILDLSKIEAGKTEFYIEEVSIYHLAHEVAATVKPLLANANDKLLLDCAADVGSMYTDQTKLRQILLNLLSNAIKFTENGEIHLSIWKQKHLSQTMVHFRVQDTGIGIPNGKMHHLFQAFSQVDVSATRKYGGSGLGLVICRYFCNMLGGEISVQSEAGKGTRFDFYLPQHLDFEGLTRKGMLVSVDDAIKHIEPLSAKG